MKLRSVSRQAHAEEFHDGRRDVKSREVEVQMSRGVHSQLSLQDVVRGVSPFTYRPVGTLHACYDKSLRSRRPDRGAGLNRSGYSRAPISRRATSHRFAAGNF
jgi:hypothetical protein